MKIKIILVAFAVSVLMYSCDTDDEPMQTEITYTNTVKSILDTNCSFSGCHGEGAVSPSFEMHNYATTVTAVSFGKIIDAINQNNGAIAMPYPPGSDKIAQQDIDDITAWINNDTPE